MTEEEELTPEMLEEMSTETLDLKDRLLTVLGGSQTRIGLSALVAATGEVICGTAPSQEEAIDAIATFSASLATLVRLADEEGACFWQSHSGETRQ